MGTITVVRTSNGGEAVKYTRNIAVKRKVPDAESKEDTKRKSGRRNKAPRSE